MNSKVVSPIYFILTSRRLEGPTFFENMYQKIESSVLRDALHLEKRKSRTQEEVAGRYGISVSSLQRAKYRDLAYGDVDAKPPKKRGPKGQLDCYMEDVSTFYMTLTTGACLDGFEGAICLPE